MVCQAITITLVSKKSSSSKKLIGKVSGFININRKTLQRAAKRRYNIEIDLVNQCWSFIGRLPHSNMKLNNENNSLIESFF